MFHFTGNWNKRLINWKNWGRGYLGNLLCRCAKLAKKDKMKFFSIQFYGKWIMLLNSDAGSKEIYNPLLRICKFPRRYRVVVGISVSWVKVWHPQYERGDTIFLSGKVHWTIENLPAKLQNIYMEIVINNIHQIPQTYWTRVAVFYHPKLNFITITLEHLHKKSW